MTQPEQQTKETFVELYDRVNRRVMAYLVRRVFDTEVAADLWAESWAVAFENWHRRRSTNPGASEAWVFGIARHQLASYYRSGNIERRALERLQWSVPPVDAALDEELERVVDREALRQDIATAIETLSLERRRAVQLRIVDGVPYHDIAARLGCSEQTARAHVSRGLRRLAKALEQRNLNLPEPSTP